MLVCECDLIGISPLGQSRHIQEKKKTGENHDAFEERTWRQRMHVNKDGHVFIPPMAIKNCLIDVAQHLAESIPGKGKKTYTNCFKRGLLCVDEFVVRNGSGKGIVAEKVEGLTVFVPSDGKRGGGTRVSKTFPCMTNWSTHVEIYIMDPILMGKPEKIQEYLQHAGQFIGIGYFRAGNGGHWGRFKVENFTSKKMDE